MWSKIAICVDVFHIVFAVGSIIFLTVGSLTKIRETLFYNIISSLWVCVVVLQVLCLNCPLTQLSNLLRSFDNPDVDIYIYDWGFIYWIYHDMLGLSVSVMAITIVSIVCFSLCISNSYW
jgi:hypothetical protein